MLGRIDMITAFRGEFGHKIQYHVPWVYAQGPGHVIEIEEGEEALYPLAKEWRIVPRAHDDSRHGRTRLKGPMKRFVPEPHVPQAVGAPDIVYCPRRRKYGAAKNWDGWDHVEWELCKEFVVFGAGAPDSSITTLGPGAWDFDRFLDATIRAMRNAKLVIATGAGLAHLAVLCGAPLLLVTYRGLTAPGPQMNVEGRIMRPKHDREDINRYMQSNHTGSPIEMIDGWEHPERVVQRAREIVDAKAKAV